MESEEDKLCSIHKAEKDNYCIVCKKAMCLSCKFEHQKEHPQIIHLAELATNMITQVKERLELLKFGVNREYDEIMSMIKEFDDDKKLLFGMVKKIERMVVQMLVNTTTMMSKSLQKTDEDLKALKCKIEIKKDECENSEKLLKQLMDYNTKKDFWQIYKIQEKIKKDKSQGTPSFVIAELKRDAVKEISSRGSSKTKGVEILVPGIPNELIIKKDETKKSVAVTDYYYMNEISKEYAKAIKVLTTRIGNLTSQLKQNQNIVYIKNNPDPIIKKNDKLWLAQWLLNGKTGKAIELELLYKGLRDKFTSKEFHTRCDGKYPTLTVIASGDQVFGGYTAIPWASSNPGVFVEDSSAFTFSITKKAKCPIMAGKRQSAVRHLEGRGPIFGSTDIFISENDSEKSESEAIGNVCYAVPPGVVPDPKAFYSPDKNFKLRDIEVYRVKVY